MSTRKTSRVTNSTSVTGPGLPVMAAVIPRDLIEQATLDLENDALWRAGEGPGVRESLGYLLAGLESAKTLTEEELGKVFRIVRYNDQHYPHRRRAPAPGGTRSAGPTVGCQEHLGQVLPITCVKDFHLWQFWDDRSVQVITNTGEVLAEQHAHALIRVKALEKGLLEIVEAVANPLLGMEQP